MTWLSQRLLVKQQRRLQIENQQLFLIKQAQLQNREEIKENFNNFATSLPGLLTFTASGVFYELMQPTQSEQSNNKSESSVGGLQGMFFIAKMLQLF